MWMMMMMTMMMMMQMTMATTMIMTRWRPLRTRCFFVLEFVSICNHAQKTLLRCTSERARYCLFGDKSGRHAPPSGGHWQTSEASGGTPGHKTMGKARVLRLSWSHVSADRRDERGAAPLKRLRREKLQSRRGARPTPRAGSGHRADVANNPTTARVNETVRMGRRPRQREVYFRDAVTAAM